MFNLFHPNIPEYLNNIVAVSAGYEHALALSEDGEVFAWGNNDYGACDIPEDLNNIVAVSADNIYSLAFFITTFITVLNGSGVCLVQLTIII